MEKKNGRPSVEEVGKNRTIRMTDRDWLDFKTLLGAEWLRQQIAKARAKANQKTTASN